MQLKNVTWKSQRSENSAAIAFWSQVSCIQVVSFDLNSVAFFQVTLLSCIFRVAFSSCVFGILTNESMQCTDFRSKLQRSILEYTCRVYMDKAQVQSGGRLHWEWAASSIMKSRNPHKSMQFFFDLMEKRQARRTTAHY
jgi:hypothetical protein